MAYICTTCGSEGLQDGRTPLHLAAYSGDTGMLQLLLARGAQLEAQRLDGQTPLFEAAEGSSVEAVRALLLAGANAGMRLTLQHQ